jgi:hypothetical protein
MRKPLTCTLLAVTLLAGATATAGADSRYLGISGYSEAPVEGAPDINYVVRTSYIVPASWNAAKAKRGAITRRFGPFGSCRYRMTVTARAIADAGETPVARVTRLLPATRQYLRDEGTRGGVAWRVIRVKGTDDIIGKLVRPAPTVLAQPQGKRVWLELNSVGRPDPATECHAGGPRSVAAGFGDMLAAGALGGFASRR